MLKIIFLFLMSGGIPVAMAMAGASLIYILMTNSSPPFVVIHRMVSGIDSFPLLAVPFFILAGNLMNNAGITNRIYNYALALVGWLKGGLGHVNVVGSVVFAGMSGTAIADAAGLGTIEVKAMTDHGYSKEFAVGVTAASATLGPIIPPSLPFVIYGMMANVSVGALFLAGILPGVLMALLMMLTVAYFAHLQAFHFVAVFEGLVAGRVTRAIVSYSHRLDAGLGFVAFRQFFEHIALGVFQQVVCIAEGVGVVSHANAWKAARCKRGARDDDVDRAKLQALVDVAFFA